MRIQKQTLILEVLLLLSSTFLFLLGRLTGSVRCPGGATSHCSPLFSMYFVTTAKFANNVTEDRRTPLLRAAAKNKWFSFELETVYRVFHQFADLGWVD